MYDKWCNVLDTVPERERALSEEMTKQQTNEQLRVAFAEKANALSVYIQDRATELAERSMKALGTMEVRNSQLTRLQMSSVHPFICSIFHPQDQLQALIAFEAETLSRQHEMESAEETHRQIQAALIFDNKHATISMEVRDSENCTL